MVRRERSVLGEPKAISAPFGPHRLEHVPPPTVQVQVGPSESEDFAPPHPRLGCHDEGDIVWANL